MSNVYESISESTLVFTQNGNCCIPDFVCIQKKLIIELDGSRHLEQKEYDDERTKYFESLGYRVIRFWNNQIMNDINGVIKAIQFALEGKIQVWKNSKG